MLSASNANKCAWRLACQLTLKSMNGTDESCCLALICSFAIGDLSLTSCLIQLLFCTAQPPMKMLCSIVMPMKLLNVQSHCHPVFLAFIDWHLLPKIQQDGSFFPMQPMWKRCSSTGNGWLGYVSEGKDNKGKLVQLSFLLHLWGGVDSHWLMVRKNRNHINFLQENPTQPPERAFGSTIFSSKCIRLDLLPMSRIFDNWKAVWESIQFQWGRWQDQRWMCKWHKNTVHVLALCKFQEWIMPCGRKQISTTRDRSLSTHLLLSHKPKQMTSSNHLHPQQGRDLG